MSDWRPFFVELRSLMILNNNRVRNIALTSDLYKKYTTTTTSKTKRCVISYLHSVATNGKHKNHSECVLQQKLPSH